MAFALVVNTGAGSTTANNVTTSAIDTTGASLIVCAVGSTHGVSANVSDSKSNTWSSLTLRQPSSGVRHRLWYVASPVVGTGHTFTVTTSGGAPAICVTAWSGAHTSPFDVENGATTNSGTSLATGSITPSENDELVIAGISNDTAASARTIGSGFTITDDITYVAGQHKPSTQAYLIQTTAAAVNPTWSWTTSDRGAACIASFKIAAAATGQPIVKRLGGIPFMAINRGIW
jgi:hypothetical protein